MIENDTASPIQAAHMEAAALLAEAVEKATALGFTICVSGNAIDVYQWNGRPLIAEIRGDGFFQAEYLTNLIDWLDGVAFGRTNVLGEPPDDRRPASGRSSVGQGQHLDTSPAICDNRAQRTP